MFSSPSPVPVSISKDETVTVNAASSLVAWSVRISREGESFIGSIKRVNDSESSSKSMSLTVTYISMPVVLK